MWSDDAISSKLVYLKPLLDASIDPICLVNTKREIVFIDLAMKSLLGLKGRELKKRLLIWDLLKLPIGPKDDPVTRVIQSGRAIRIDELPGNIAGLRAQAQQKKIRVSLKIAPVRDADGVIVGAIIAVRDTTGEVILQAKYHKLLEVLKMQDQRVKDLEDRVFSLQASMRRTRNT